MITANGYDVQLAAAYIRGASEMTGAPPLSSELLKTPLGALTDRELSQIIRAGITAGQKLYYFKKKEDLPRVSAVLGFLRGCAKVGDLL